MYNMKEAVNAGVHYLDSIHPGWHNEIDTDELLMTHVSRCVCGQLKEDRFCCNADLGFYVPEYGPLDFSYGNILRSRAWRALTQMWKRKIEQRKMEYSYV